VIVAVTHEGDEHLAPVRDALARLGEAVEVVDHAAVPGGWRLALGEDPARWTLTGPGRRRVRGAEVRAVWWRRLRPVEVDTRLSPPDARFARVQYEEALAGFWDGLPARFVNPPRADERAGHKVALLAAARRAGLAVPATLVTDDPDRARAFLRRCGPAVHKPLLALRADHYTQPVDRAARRDLDALRLAPAILQAFVPGVDVRVTAVGGRLFGCAIDARRTGSPHDFRRAFDEAVVSRCRVPAPVAAALRRLLRDLGLAYGAADFRVREADGAWLFLEVNPSGQWLGFEARTGHPITEAVAALLAGRAD
jgi:hypothetical protein